VSAERPLQGRGVGRSAPQAPGPADLGSAFDDPPEEVVRPTPNKPWVTRQATRHIDFAERDARNRRLDRAGRPDLAKRVDWVSENLGDGSGYDVESFDEADGTPLRIEVKTTTPRVM
jgi:hypothetical protein